jgi:photosystem II stability/assembly factor-like uncharacterized protein
MRLITSVTITTFLHSNKRKKTDQARVWDADCVGNSSQSVTQGSSQGLPGAAIEKAIPHPPFRVWGINGVYASDASNVWVVGSPEEGNNYGTILHSTDGGDTWVKVPYTITHTPPPTGYYLITVHGANANEVWAVGRGQIMHISVTRKGISVTDQTPGFSSYMDVNGVYALNPRTIWAVADSGNIWRSDNGGKKWTLRNAGQYNHGYLLRVSAIDGMNAWATESDQYGGGQIVYTSNGGKSWVPQTIPVQTGMWAISFVK